MRSFTHPHTHPNINAYIVLAHTHFDIRPAYWTAEDTMARSKRGRAAQAARYRNVANGGGRPGQADISSCFLPRPVATHGQP